MSDNCINTTKKLSLKKLKLEVNDELQRNQLKSVFGGYDDGNCAITAHKLTFEEAAHYEPMTENERGEAFSWYFNFCTQSRDNLSPPVYLGGGY